MKTKTILQDSALDYLKRGFSIIPVGADKKPRIRTWKPYQTRHPSEEEVREWCQRPDVTGIAIVTGKISGGLVVLDMEEGAAWDQLDLPETPTVLTGGGGRHVYFRAVDEEGLLRNSTRFRDKMDIRGEGGYVLAPPSAHISGQSYEWLTPLGQCEIAPVPSWLITEAKDAKQNPSDSIESGVAEGQRNDATAKYVGSLLTKHAPDDWETIVWPALLAWNVKNRPPLASDELRQVYESIRKREESRRGVSVHAPTQTPRIELISEPLSLDQVLEKTRKIGFVHDYCVEVAMAVYLSTFLDQEKNPLWLLIVGNPSSNKTTLVYLLRYAPQTYRLDTMTANPFSSGQKETDKPKDLLPLINGNCFIVKDYSTLFGRNEEVVRQFVTDLVSIYDGEFTKHSPTRGTIRYESRFSHLGCITPLALNKRQQYMNMVGARFLQMEIPRLTDGQRADSLERLWANGKSNQAEEDAALAVSSFCAQLRDKLPSLVLEPESEAIVSQLNALADLTAHSRGIVITEPRKFIDKKGNESTHYEAVDMQIEEPFRALFQLRKLCRALALVRGKSEVTVSEIATVRRIVLSSMPPRRAEVLTAFRDGKLKTAREVADILGKDWKTIKRNLDELCSLGYLIPRRRRMTLAASTSLWRSFAA